MVRAQFDVYRLSDRILVVDVQSPFANVHRTRLVIPLIVAENAAPSIPRLNPALDVAGESCVLATHFATTIDAKLLTNVVASLAAEEWTIRDALDFLINGF